MGLSICVYQNLRPLNLDEYILDTGGLPMRRKDEEPMDDFTVVYAAPGFEDRCRDLEHHMYLSDGWCHERIGGYAYYGKWRSILDKFSGWLRDRDSCLRTLPFTELVNFSDCEGFLGPEVCRRLSSQFEKYDELLDEFFETGADDETKDWEDEFSQVWEMVSRLFAFAEKNGAVQFT